MGRSYVFALPIVFNFYLFIYFFKQFCLVRLQFFTFCQQMVSFKTLLFPELYYFLINWFWMAAIYNKHLREICPAPSIKCLKNESGWLIQFRGHFLRPNNLFACPGVFFFMCYLLYVSLGQFLYAFICFKSWQIFHSHLFKFLPSEKVDVYRILWNQKYTDVIFMWNEHANYFRMSIKFTSQTHPDIIQFEINTKVKEKIILWFMTVP